jgi:hypothetical protein
VRDHILGVEALYERQRLVGAGEGLVLRHAEDVALLLHGSGADGEIEAAVAEDVDCCGLLGHRQRIVQREQQHVGAEADALRARCHRRENRQWPRVPVVLGEVMLGHPEVAVAQLIGEHGSVDELLVAPRERLFLARQVAYAGSDPDFHLERSFSTPCCGRTLGRCAAGTRPSA